MYECLGPRWKRRPIHGCPISECEYIAPSACLVKRHIEDLHQSGQALPRQKSNSVNPRMPAKEERRHECHLCGRAHRSEIALHVHMKAQHSDNEAGGIFLRYACCPTDIFLHKIRSGALYRVAHLVGYLGWVDIDLGCSTFGLVLLGLMGNR